MHDNDFELPSGYGETGAPSNDLLSHAVPHPFNVYPPHAVQMEYSAPSNDQLSHAVPEPFNTIPPYAVRMGYAAPSNDQLSHAVPSPFNTIPPYAVRMAYGQDETGGKAQGFLDKLNAFGQKALEFIGGKPAEQEPASDSERPQEDEKKFPWGTVVAVAGGLAVAGTAAYFIFRKKPAKRDNPKHKKHSKKHGKKHSRKSHRSH
jgi:hypothetical protein